MQDDAVSKRGLHLTRLPGAWDYDLILHTKVNGGAELKGQIMVG